MSAASGPPVLQPGLVDRRLEGKPRIPRKVDPGILRHLGNVGVDQWATHGLGVNGGKMRARHDFAHHFGGLAGVDEVVDQKNPGPLPAAKRDDPRRYALEHRQVALIGAHIARHANRLDQLDAEFARNDGRRHQTAAGDADDGFERTGPAEPPSERTRIAVKLVPRHRKDFSRIAWRGIGRLYCLDLGHRRSLRRKSIGSAAIRPAASKAIKESRRPWSHRRCRAMPRAAWSDAAPRFRGFSPISRPPPPTW